MPGLVGIRAARGTINHENKRGRREKREREEKTVVRGWREREKRRSSVLKSFFGRIYASSISTIRRRIFFLFLFRFRTNVDLTLIIHVTRTPDTPAKETLLGNLLSVHGCVSIYFIYRSLSLSIDSSSQVDLWISLPVFFTILFESCPFLRVYPNVARTSFALFCPRREKARPGKPVCSFSLSHVLRDRYLFLLWGLEISRRDKFGVGCFHFCPDIK